MYIIFIIGWVLHSLYVSITTTTTTKFPVQFKVIQVDEIIFDKFLFLMGVCRVELLSWFLHLLDNIFEHCISSYKKYFIISYIHIFNIITLHNIPWWLSIATIETYLAGYPNIPASLRLERPNITGIYFSLQILKTFLSYESMPLLPGIF